MKKYISTIVAICACVVSYGTTVLENHYASTEPITDGKWEPYSACAYQVEGSLSSCGGTCGERKPTGQVRCYQGGTGSCEEKTIYTYNNYGQCKSSAALGCYCNRPSA